jgi:hypothetical protein
VAAVRPRAQQIHPPRDGKEPPPSELVRKSAEDEGTDHLANEIDRCDVAHGSWGHAERILSLRRSATSLAIVISSPSSTQATPSVITMWVWNRDQCIRSTRTGMSVLTGSDSVFAIAYTVPFEKEISIEKGCGVSASSLKG